VGGVTGYFEFLSASKILNHEEHENYTEWFARFPWYDGVFDSERYEIEKVNYELMKYLRWSRERFRPWQVGV
jgi:hypothetical protein